MSEEATLDEFAEQREDDDVSDEHPRFGSLPNDWKISEIADVAEVVGGSTPSTSNEDYWGGGIPWATPTDITALSGNTISETEDTITEEGLESTSTHLLPPKSVLMTSRATIGKCAINTVEMATNQGFKNLVPTDEIEPWYLYYRMRDTAAFLNSLGSGSTFDEVSKTEVQSVDILIPPLPEQHKISTVLYTVDRAIEKTSELIEQLGRVKQGVRQNILTSGITEDGKVRASPELEPDEYTGARQWTVPNSWELKELSDICSIQVGYAFNSDWYREKGNVRVLRGANVGYGEPDWSDTYFLEPERVSEYEDYLLNEGDLIIGMDRPYTNSGFKISRLSETDVPSLLVQRVGRFVPESCDPDYLHVVLSDWRYQKQVLRRAQGMDIPHISQTDILSPKIPLPPLDEQKRIADRYSSILERIDCEENLLREYKTLKQGLMQDLLSGTVRTTDTNIEVPEEIAQHG